MLHKNFFWISAFFGSFLTKKQPKLTENKENWQNSNCLMKFPETWYVDASQQNKKATKELFFDFGIFLAQNEEYWQNSNLLMKFSEFWYVDTFQQKKMLQKTIFRFWPFLAFLAK